MYLRDITEQKSAEEELRISEEKHRLLINGSSEGILVVQDGKLQFANKKVLDVIGRSKEELTAKPFPDLVHPDDRETMLDQYRKRTKGETSDTFFSVFLIKTEICGGLKQGEQHSSGKAARPISTF